MGTIVTNIPVVGDETSLAKVYADPASYYGKPFVVVGVMKVDRDYDYAYRGMNDICYSLWFVQESGVATQGKSLQVYAEKPTFKPLVDAVAAVEDIGGWKVIRLKVVITDRGFDRGGWHQQVELANWAEMKSDHTGWGEWHLREN